MNENYNKDFAVPHCPGFDASGSVLPVLLPVFRHGVRHCRVSVVPAGDRGIVRRTGGRIYRLPGSGVAGKPLRTAAGGLLADGTGAASMFLK